MSKWEIKNLGSVAIFRGGGTPFKGNSSFWTGDIPWISPKDMKTREVDSSIDTINLDAVKNSTASLIPKGSILMVVRSGILARTIPVALTTKELTVNQDIKALCPLEFIDAYFLLYYLESQETNILQLVTRGATVHRLPSESLKALEVPVPTLAEQKRIVAMLDEVFEGIDGAIANTKKNLTNAHELFESYLNVIFTRKGNDWEEKELQKLVKPDCSLSYGIVQPGEEYAGGLPIVRPTDLTSKVISLDGLKRIDPQRAASYQRTKLVGGELLLCVRGSTGTVSIAANRLEGANVTRGIVPIRFEPSIVSQAFGYYMLISKVVQDQIKEQTYGAALMQINIRDLKKITLSFPELKDQNSLAKALNHVEKETQRLETIYQQKLATLNELKQSILQKAFSGELTADTADQAANAAQEVAAA